jgi:hypothetical protein
MVTEADGVKIHVQGLEEQIQLLQERLIGGVVTAATGANGSNPGKKRAQSKKRFSICVSNDAEFSLQKSAQLTIDQGPDLRQGGGSKKDGVLELLQRASIEKAKQNAEELNRLRVQLQGRVAVLGQCSLHLRSLVKKLVGCIIVRSSHSNNCV